MKEKEFGNIYSLGEDLDERFAWCVQLSYPDIGRLYCYSLHYTIRTLSF